MNRYKKPKMFGKNDDGHYEGRIEQIGVGSDEDTLMISNRKVNGWIFSLLNGYRQLGNYKVKNPHDFKEGQDVVVHLINDKIVNVK